MVVIIIIFIIVKVEELNSDLSKSHSPEPGLHDSQVWSGLPAASRQGSR